ncbi:FAD-dependent oxidoreductase [Puniceicoccus vermicola]|uniref:FAD-dependent oxidoreductase n=1 Tax=Puniceicoccus vermicola TaxID=388746 RepID=A0A7X1E4N5_9BACT|nr:FAD-dependent oxidoreductase [Puniceicoccus vermicola]MBC2600802.1 FAD-dependent oxidoreductase [Puniceicoccus vermicola]
MKTLSSIRVPSADIPVQAGYDVIVCGGGPAGIAAAIAAARSGARTCLVEHHGYLGGVWTAGLLSFILDAREKPGLIREIRRNLAAQNAIQAERDLYDAEVMKRVLETLCAEADVHIRLYSQLVSVAMQGCSISHVILEGKEGRFALEAKSFVDTTGDGNLGALAECQFELGRPSDSKTQPMTLMALVSGVPETVRCQPYASRMSGSCINKDEFYGKLCDEGCETSYTKPSLFPLTNGLCCLMANHEYERSGLKSQDLSEASIHARQELHAVVEAMKRFPGEGWECVSLVATAASIGVREGRRLRGRYVVSLEDVLGGARFDDAVTRVQFPIDVHSILRSEGGGYSSDSVHTPAQPFDIPLRALMALDVDNLAMAGRCISGDFFAHASYRVTGNAVATGEAAGIIGAVMSTESTDSNSVDPHRILKELSAFRRACDSVGSH